MARHSQGKEAGPLRAQPLPRVLEPAASKIPPPFAAPGVEKKEFKAQLVELYGVFLAACLGSSQVVPSELGEIKKLGGLLSLSRADVGSAFHTAGRRLYSRHRAYLEETGPNDSKVLLDKFVFLAERVLSQDESEEGYRYEAMRAQKVHAPQPNPAAQPCTRAVHTRRRARTPPCTHGVHVLCTAHRLVSPPKPAEPPPSPLGLAGLPAFQG